MEQECVYRYETGSYVKMDIVEFTENICGIKLLDYQKAFLRKTVNQSVYIPMCRHNGYSEFMPYVNQNTLRELTQSGKTLDSNKEMSVMRKEC